MHERLSPLSGFSEGSDPCDDKDYLQTARLMISDDLALESQGTKHVVVVNTRSAKRMRLSLPAYRFLKSFQTPLSINQVLPLGAVARILPHVRVLIEKHMLIDVDARLPLNTTRQRTPVAHKFCGAPAYVESIRSDFVILGAPYDLAGDIHSRLAPTLIRQKSLDYVYQLQFNDGQPCGWFDADRCAWILRGARIADAGDVYVEYGESQDRFFKRVRDSLRECYTDQSVPVILGGDRSVTAAGVGGLCHDHKLTVVQITANPLRAAAEMGEWLVSQKERVERFISIGSANNDEAQPPGGDVLIHTVSMLRECGPEKIVLGWGKRLSIYLSIDLDIATATNMANVSGALPLGPTLHELKALIAAIGKAHRVIGLDLVGLDLQSASPALSAVIGCHLALAGMSAAHDYR
jgi:agmatinase